MMPVVAGAEFVKLQSGKELVAVPESKQAKKKPVRRGLWGGALKVLRVVAKPLANTVRERSSSMRLAHRVSPLSELLGFDLTSQPEVTNKHRLCLQHIRGSRQSSFDIRSNPLLGCASVV